MHRFWECVGGKRTVSSHIVQSVNRTRRAASTMGESGPGHSPGGDDVLLACGCPPLHVGGCHPLRVCSRTRPRRKRDWSHG